MYTSVNSVTQLVKGCAKSRSYYITTTMTPYIYYKLLLRSIGAVAKAGSYLLFLHILTSSLRQTGVAPSSCPGNINGAIGGVCMGRYGPCVPSHLQPSSVVLVYAAVALGWCGEVK